MKRRTLHPDAVDTFRIGQNVCIQRDSQLTVLIQFLPGPAANVHRGLAAKTVEERFPGFEFYIFRRRGRRDFRHGFSMVGHDITVALPNPVQQLREFPVGFRCGYGLFHVALKIVIFTTIPQIHPHA